MQRVLTIFLIIITFSLIGFVGHAQAFDLERLIMPGPLYKGHAKYENDCEKCHNPLDKSKHRANCLACHKEVAADISAKTGFHGKNEDVGENECLHCHTEHQGRDGDIILMDLDNFDHSNTDFQLKNSHLKVQCDRCHLADKKFREAKGDCVSCHKSVEPHKGALGDNCQSCHQETSWKDFTFDHQKTKFHLEGVHSFIPCIRCHANQQWKQLPTQCVGCHKLNDVHVGRFGEACEKCHTTSLPTNTASLPDSTTNNWRNTRFDHAKTSFQLTGKHSKVACMQCHVEIELSKENTKKKKAPGCFDCHQKNDAHKTRFGLVCEKCHTTEGWQKPTLDHSTTKFPLTESHTKVTCIKCHTGTIFEQKLDLTCNGCHRLDDRHGGSFGTKCDSCHTPKTWKNATYDHTKTKFPLMGRHTQVTCSKCHNAATSGEKLQTDCNACHQKDDVHQGQEGPKCEKCHNVEGWRTKVFFDHDLTNFPLIGLHSVSPCEACHMDTTFKSTPTTCEACHQNKDPHQGVLGTSCSSCHTPNGWRIWEFDHDAKTKFTLTGSHIGLDCRACHKKPMTALNHTPTKCEQCHLKDDAHRGKYGKFCDRCHITESFKTLRIGQ